MTLMINDEGVKYYYLFLHLSVNEAGVVGKTSVVV